ncbi:MAG: hypothetical protein HC893_10850 [Chloroflexaceae bacterium]|nr:hypothetical protein [Chloroflexaceae bacterium]
MTQPSISISVFFDFLCPYAYRTAMWLDQVRDKMVDRDFEINWRYFSLEQVNLPAGSDWKVWEQADEYEHPNPERNGPTSAGCSRSGPPKLPVSRGLNVLTVSVPHSTMRGTIPPKTAR